MGEKKNDILFGKAAFGGFNRRDVMAYIDTLQREAQEKVAAVTEDLQTQMQAVCETLTETKGTNAELLREVETLRAQAEDLQAQLKVAEAEIEILRSKDDSPKSLDEVDAMVHRNMQ